MKAKSPREFMTFGIMVYGSIIEYYIHQYHPPQSSTEAPPSTSAPYTFKLIQKCTLPTLSSTGRRGTPLLVMTKKQKED